MSEQKRSILHTELEYLGAQFSTSTEGFNLAQSFYGEKPLELQARSRCLHKLSSGPTMESAAQTLERPAMKKGPAETLESCRLLVFWNFLYA